jgi:type III secretory pathway component EscT
MPALVGSILALSLGVTKIVDMIRNLPWFKGKAVGSWVWNVVAFVVGLGIAVGWRHDLSPAAVALVPALANLHLSSMVGEVLTGVVIGGGAGFFHELLDSLSSVANRNNR